MNNYFDQFGQPRSVPYGLSLLSSDQYCPIEGDRTNADAEAIYIILEEQVVPLYYRISDNGIPTEWIKIMKNAMKGVGVRFSARRMVKEYVQKFYSVAAQSS